MNNPLIFSRLSVRKADFEAVAERNGYACWKIGNLFLEGRGVERNSETALEWYRKSAELGCSLGFRSAGLLLSSGLVAKCDPAEGLDYFEQGARLGDLECMFQAGRCHLYGIGSEAFDLEKAQYYFERASHSHTDAEAYYFYHEATGTTFPVISRQESLARLMVEAQQNNVKANLAIGVVWQSGFLGYQDLEKARSAFEYAHERGCLESTFRLGKLLVQTSSDIERGINLLERASHAGHAPAKRELAGCYADSLMGNKPNLDQATDLLKKAILLGDALANVWLASILIQHMPSEENLHYSADLLEVAHINGVGEATNLLKRLWQCYPKIFPRSEARVRGWIIKSSVAGDAQAMLDLAEYCLYLSVADDDLGMFWLSTACEEGYSRAYYALGYELMARDSKEEGLRYLHLASDLECIDSTYELAKHYLSSSDKKDHVRGVSFLRKASKAGQSDAQKLLSKILYEGRLDHKNYDEAGYWAYLASQQKADNDACQVVSLQDRKGGA